MDAGPSLDSTTANPPDAIAPSDAPSSDSMTTDSGAQPDGAAADTGPAPLDAAQNCTSFGGDCSGTATCCAPYVCSGPTYDCLPDGGHCPWTGGFVCETAPPGQACAPLGGSCKTTSCCAPYVCSPNDGWTCTAPGTCATFGQNCANTPCCDPYTCNLGTNACDFDYCDYAVDSCTYQTICCNGPCDTSGGGAFGLCP
ncbi:MAG TPA: hypothetical protein VIJ22_13855 [Polyangiaceae bacterium]